MSFEIRVNEILHYAWDPIGIWDHPSARDEYDSYAVQVVNAVRSGAKAEDVQAVLAKIRSEAISQGPSTVTRKEELVSWAILEAYRVLEVEDESRERQRGH